MAVPTRHTTPQCALHSVQAVSGADRFFVACTDSRVAPSPSNTGTGVQSCGNNKYCCGKLWDCCTAEADVFTLPEAEVVRTISAYSSYNTAGSTGSLESAKHSNALAIGLGVGVGVGGFLLLALGVLYVLKRRARAKHHSGYERAKRHSGYEKKEEASEMDGSFSTELPDTSPKPAPSKVGYSAPVGGVVHEIGEGGAGPSIPPQELEARPRYDWEPRNEPEPRDGGFRPVDHDRNVL